MEHNLDKNSTAISDIVSANLDREIKEFLDIYKLPFDKNELRKLGYCLVIESSRDTEKTYYKVLLCEVKGVKQFNIKVSLKVN